MQLDTLSNSALSLNTVNGNTLQTSVTPSSTINFADNLNAQLQILGAATGLPNSEQPETKPPNINLVHNQTPRTATVSLATPATLLNAAMVNKTTPKALVESANNGVLRTMLTPSSTPDTAQSHSITATTLPQAVEQIPVTPSFDLTHNENQTQAITSTSELTEHTNPVARIEPLVNFDGVSLYSKSSAESAPIDKPAINTISNAAFPPSTLSLSIATNTVPVVSNETTTLAPKRSSINTADTIDNTDVASDTILRDRPSTLTAIINAGNHDTAIPTVQANLINQPVTTQNQTPKTPSSTRIITDTAQSHSITATTLPQAVEQIPATLASITTNTAPIVSNETTTLALKRSSINTADTIDTASTTTSVVLSQMPLDTQTLSNNNPPNNSSKKSTKKILPTTTPVVETNPLNVLTPPPPLTPVGRMSQTTKQTTTALINTDDTINTTETLIPKTALQPDNTHVNLMSVSNKSTSDEVPVNTKQWATTLDHQLHSSLASTKMPQDNAALVFNDSKLSSNENQSADMPLSTNVVLGLAESHAAIAATQTTPAIIQQSAKDTAVEFSTVQAHVYSERWTEELSSKIVWLAQNNITSAEVQLNPPHLGPLLIQVQMQQDQTTITFTTHTVGVKEMLEANMPQLRDLLQTQQLNLTEVTVSQQTPSNSGQNTPSFFNQNQSGQRNAYAPLVENSIENPPMDEVAQQITQSRALVTQGLVSFYA